MEPVAPGRILRGKYEVLRTLGSGGMGVVVLARSLRMEQPVAIKLLHAETKGRGDLVERFAREARAASRLRGIHAVRILDVDDSETGDPFLVMEYVEGIDLQRLVTEEGPLPIDRVLELALQACEGVAEAHGVGIVHRDLKPANLLLTKAADGAPLVKLLDFGISKLTDVEDPASAGITKPDTAIGSPAYMSPEQIKNAGEVDPRTDVWALGVVIFHLLTKALPFEAPTTAALAARIASDPPRDIRSLRSDLPAPLAEAIERCLAKAPAERFADVGALAAALARVSSSAEHEARAARIARVLAAPVARVATEKETTSLPTATPAAVGPPTASLVDVTAPPSLESAIQTEYGSALRNRTDAPRPAPRRAMGSILAALGVVTLVGVGGVVTRARLGPAAAKGDAVALLADAGGAAPSSFVDASSSSSVASSSPQPPSSSAVTSSSAQASSTLPTARAIRRGGATPAPARSTKNPMDLDFR